VRTPLRSVVVRSRLQVNPFLLSCSSFSSSPSSSTPDPTQSAIPTMEKTQLEHLIRTKSEYTLIDVRNSFELDFGVIPTAVHIPLDQLDGALRMSPDSFEKKYNAKLNGDQQLIFYCLMGSRSAKATELAFRHGFTKAVNYKGSFGEWFGFTYRTTPSTPTPKTPK